MALYDLNPASNVGLYDFVQPTKPFFTDGGVKRWLDTTNNLSWRLSYYALQNDIQAISEEQTSAVYPFTFTATGTTQNFLVPELFLAGDSGTGASPEICKATISIHSLSANHTNAIFNTLKLEWVGTNAISSSTWASKTNTTGNISNTIDTKLLTIANCPYVRSFATALWQARLFRLNNVATGAVGTMIGYLHIATRLSYYPAQLN